MNYGQGELLSRKASKFTALPAFLTSWLEIKHALDLKVCECVYVCACSSQT